MDDFYNLCVLAELCVGEKESPPKSNRGPEVDVYTGGRAEPWCALWVAYIFRVCGMALPGDVEPTPKRANPLASVTHMEARLKKAGWLLTSHQKPKPGDIVFYKTREGSDPGTGRHVGLVTEVFADGYASVEGNWGDCVAKRHVKFSDSRIANYGRFGGV